MCTGVFQLNYIMIRIYVFLFVLRILFFFVSVRRLQSFSTVITFFKLMLACDRCFYSLLISLHDSSVASLIRKHYLLFFIRIHFVNNFCFYFSFFLFVRYMCVCVEKCEIHYDLGWQWHVYKLHQKFNANKCVESQCIPFRSTPFAFFFPFETHIQAFTCIDYEAYKFVQ